MALVEIDKQLEIIRDDVKKASLKNNLSLLEKIDVIEWHEDPSTFIELVTRFLSK